MKPEYWTVGYQQASSNTGMSDTSKHGHLATAKCPYVRLLKSGISYS
jgi:hypothetical protein